MMLCSKSLSLNRRILFSCSGLVLALCASSRALAQLSSNTATVTLNASLAESLTLSATPSAVSFTLIPGGTAVGSAPVAVVTTWTLQASRANLNLYGYFAAAANALTDGMTTPNLIPTSEVLGQVTTGLPLTYTAFTQTHAGFGGALASLQLYTLPLTALNRAGTRMDNLNLEINLSAQPQLPAGTYTGTLTLVAQAL